MGRYSESAGPMCERFHRYLAHMPSRQPYSTGTLMGYLVSHVFWSGLQINEGRDGHGAAFKSHIANWQGGSAGGEFVSYAPWEPPLYAVSLLL